MVAGCQHWSPNAHTQRTRGHARERVGEAAPSTTLRRAGPPLPTLACFSHPSQGPAYQGRGGVPRWRWRWRLRLPLAHATKNACANACVAARSRRGAAQHNAPRLGRAPLSELAPLYAFPSNAARSHWALSAMDWHGSSCIFRGILTPSGERVVTRATPGPTQSIAPIKERKNEI